MTRTAERFCETLNDQKTRKTMKAHLCTGYTQLTLECVPNEQFEITKDFLYGSVISSIEVGTINRPTNHVIRPNWINKSKRLFTIETSVD